MKKNEKLPKLYLSAGFLTTPDTEKAWLKRTGVKYRCFSYAYVRPDAFYYDPRMAAVLDVDIKNGVGIMMDSSAFSFHRMMYVGKKKNLKYHQVEKMQKEVMLDYIEFIKERGKQFDFYVNCDFKKDSPYIYKMQQTLERAGIKPMPMTHGDKNMSWLQRYIDEGYDYIGIGSSAAVRSPAWKSLRYYYDAVFALLAKYPKVRVHGFAQTSYAMMFGYPWYSVDSASWAKISAYGQILMPKPRDGMFKLIHVSERHSQGNKVTYNKMEKSIRKTIEDYVESFGFNFGKVRKDHIERATFNAYLYAHINDLKPDEPIFSRVEYLSDYFKRMK